ncbi:MAG: formylglycine-generating enzyme family protein [Thiotrichales bacterium]
MTDLEREPNPQARAAIGRALGRFGLDRRRGVGLRDDALRDIDWLEVPAGPFIYQKDGDQPRRSLTLPSFFIARYPITNAQFQAFVDAGGYGEDTWWAGLHQRIAEPRPSAWNEPNAPRETVSWYEAAAFTRWLSAGLGYAISLPTEEQWEKAARGVDGREFPWGNGYRAGYANCSELAEGGGFHVDRPTAVGLYPHARSPLDVEDMSGNVWEWCLIEYRDPANTSLEGEVARVQRGGSWFNYPTDCRAACRGSFVPGYRFDLIGFRLCCASPIE